MSMAPEESACDCSTIHSSELSDLVHLFSLLLAASLQNTHPLQILKSLRKGNNVKTQFQLTLLNLLLYSWRSCHLINGGDSIKRECSKSEREKKISYINTCIWNLEKMVLMNIFAEQERRYRHREQALDTAWKGEGGMNWESSVETFV